MLIAPEHYPYLAEPVGVPMDGMMHTFKGVCVDDRYEIAAIVMPSGEFAITQFLPEVLEHVEASLREQIARAASRTL